MLDEKFCNALEAKTNRSRIEPTGFGRDVWHKLACCLPMGKWLSQATDQIQGTATAIHGNRRGCAQGVQTTEI